MSVGEPTDGLPGSKVRLFVGLGIALALLVATAVVFALVVGGDEPVTPSPVAVAPHPEETEATAPPAVEEPVLNDENVAEEGSQETVMITIESTPEDTEVWRGGELLGNTPRPIPRPAAGERMDLTLRHAGYVEQHVTISSLTAENVRISLERERRERVARATHPNMRGSSSAMGAASADNAASTPPASASSTATPQMAEPDMRRPTQSEVLDPWNSN